MKHPARPIPSPRPLLLGLGLSLLSGVLPGCDAGFEAVSVWPRQVYDGDQSQIFIYGHGFEEGSQVSVSWTDPDGIRQTAPLQKIQFLDEYTLKAELPDLSGKVGWPIFPYLEFTAYYYDSEPTPGLYDCETLEPVLFAEGASQTYCDVHGQQLKYFPWTPASPVVPPGEGDDTVLAYASWYDRLYSCSFELTEESTLTEDQLALLVPDYGLGCFAPVDDIAEVSKLPLHFTYCPLQLPAAEVDIVVTLPDSKSSQILGALTLQDWGHDYYWNPDYGDRVKGSFGAPLEVAAGQDPSGLALGDLNLDGALDLAISVRGQNALYVVTGPAFDPSDEESTRTRLIELGESVGGPGTVVAADFTRDGWPDLVTTDDHLQTVRVFRAIPPDVVGELPEYSEVTSIALDMEPRELAVADLNGDLVPDILVSGVDGDEGLMRVLLQKSDGNLQMGDAFSVGTTGLYFALGDYDGNLSLDVVTTNYKTGSLSIWPNNGNATFASVTPLHKNIGTTPGRLATQLQLDNAGAVLEPRLVDLSGDGSLDLAVSSQDTRSVLFFTEGGFLKVSLDSQALDLVLADANQDGAVDVVTVNEDGRVSVVVADARGGFALLRSVPGAEGADRILAAPLESLLEDDTDDDVVLLSSQPSAATLLFNPSTIGEYFDVTLQGCSI